MRMKIKVATAYAAGRSHLAAGTPCQDRAAGLHFRDRKSSVIVLADGAGSRPLSGEGAEFLTGFIPGLLMENFDRYSKNPQSAGPEIVGRSLMALDSHARLRGRLPGDFACTLLFAFLRKNRRNLLFLAGHLGDGVIAGYDGSMPYLLSGPDRGAHANETFFVTSRDAAERMRVYSGKAGPDCGFMLMSDGAAESLHRRRDGVMAPAVASIFRIFDNLPQKKTEDELRGCVETILRPRTTDDCSLAVVKASGTRRIWE